MAVSDSWRGQPLGDRFFFAGFNPRFDCGFDPFGAVFNAIVVPYEPINARSHAGANPCG
jgi:hypothetical protein